MFTIPRSNRRGDFAIKKSRAASTRTKIFVRVKKKEKEVSPETRARDSFITRARPSRENLLSSRARIVHKKKEPIRTPFGALLPPSPCAYKFPHVSPRFMDNLEPGSRRRRVRRGTLKFRRSMDSREKFVGARLWNYKYKRK